VRLDIYVRVYLELGPVETGCGQGRCRGW